MVDYLQMVRGQGNEERKDLEIGEISRGFKALAKELRVPVLALSQLNRSVEKRDDKRPQLSDLRECVTGETLVVMSDGRRVPIRELVGTTPEVIAVETEGKLRAAASDKVWRVGQRKVYRLTLATGRCLRATGRHRLLGSRGFVRVSDLRVGDRLAIARRVPAPGATERWPERRLVLLGHLIGDGSYLPHQPLRYTTGSEENSRAVAAAAEVEFGARVSRHEGRGNWHQLVISGNGNRWHPAGTSLWLRELGIFGQRSREKRIPAEVFRLADDQIAVLLRHLWATDGTITPRRTGARGSAGVFFATASLGLAHDVAAMLLRLGIIGRIRTVYQGASGPWYTVNISGADQLRTFLDRVGAFGPRQPGARRLAVELKHTKAVTNVDTVPREVFERVRALMAARGISQRAMAAARGTSYGGTAHYKFAPSRATLASYAEILDSDELRVEADNELFWDTVAEIVPDGVEDVYDLTVPGPATWLADGIVSHNSGAIEQDADLICFIYRDAVYRKREQQQQGRSDEPIEDENVAEIIIGKQRNGPTGTVKLFFAKQFTRFENLARGRDD
jgi:replicative DNA helicase